MSKFLLRVIALVATVAATVLMALSLPAVAEGNYSPPKIPDNPPKTVEPGTPVKVDYTSDVDCDWDSSFAEQSGTPGTGQTYSTTFTAPQAAGTYVATVKCTYASDSGVKDQTATRTVSVKVGDATAEAGALASTGGPSWMWPAAGGLLVLAGGGVAVAARRRRSLN